MELIGFCHLLSNWHMIGRTSGKEIHVQNAYADYKKMESLHT